MRERKTTSVLKWMARFFLISTLLLVFYFTFTFFQVLYYARNDQVKKDTTADAIVVLGAAQYNGKPSPVLRARLDHALSLFEEDVAPLIIVTGGNRDGDNTTEASASADYLLNHGVQDTEILRENKSTSTYESLRDVGVIAEDNNIETVVLVTDGFHQLRTRLIAESNDLKVISSKVPNSPISGSQEAKHFFTETGRVALGRVIGFRRVSRDSQLGEFVKERSSTFGEIN